MVQEVKTEDWRILDINHQDNMVILVTSSKPTVKRYGAPATIDKAEISNDSLMIYCEDGVTWRINISDGARRKV